MTEPSTNLPQAKQTVLGLYVTAKAAFGMWKNASDKVRILDVRTPEEYLFVGHPDMAWKIPVAAQSYVWDAAVPHAAVCGLRRPGEASGHA